MHAEYDVLVLRALRVLPHWFVSSRVRIEPLDAAYAAEETEQSTNSDRLFKPHKAWGLALVDVPCSPGGLQARVRGHQRAPLRHWDLVLNRQGLRRH